MDVALIRKLLDRTPIEDLRKYLEVYNSDAEALKIWEYNLKPGNLTGFNCSVCHNKRHLMNISEDRPRIMRICGCHAKRAILVNASSSNMGELHKKRFSNFQALEDWQKAMFKTAKNFVADGGKGWFAVFGQTGCGKTHLCSAIANQLLGNGRQVVYMIWATEIRQLKRLATDPQYDRIFDRFRTAEVLYIDDLFKGKVTEVDVQTCYDPINCRYINSRLTTILSSELSLSQIQQIDGAIAGRIKERCGVNFVTLSPDLAKKNGG